MAPTMSDARPAQLSRSTWFTPERVAVGVIALAAGTAATPALGRFDPVTPRHMATALTVCTTLLGVVLACWALRARTRAGVAATALVGGALLGALNAGLVFSTLAVSQGRFSEAVFDLLAGMFIGSFIGGPLGAAFGTAFLPVLTAAWPARRAPSLDALEPVFLASGALLTLVGAFSAWHQPLALWCAGLGLVALGFVLAALAFARDARRLQWTHSVRAGRVPGFAIVAPPAGADLRGLLPVFRGAAATPPDAVLVGSRRDADAPFRTNDHFTPLARVHARAEHERPSAQRRMALAIGVMALAAACVAASRLGLAAQR